MAKPLMKVILERLKNHENRVSNLESRSAITAGITNAFTIETARKQYCCNR